MGWEWRVFVPLADGIGPRLLPRKRPQRRTDCYLASRRDDIGEAPPCGEELYCVGQLTRCCWHRSGIKVRGGALADARKIEVKVRSEATKKWHLERWSKQKIAFTSEEALAAKMRDKFGVETYTAVRIAGRPLPGALAPSMPRTKRSRTH